MSDEFGDFNSAVRMRKVLHKLAKEAIDTYSPRAKRGTIVSVDRIAMKALVILEDDTEPVNLNIPAGHGPWGEGDLVLVNTTTGAMKIEKMIYSPLYPGGVSIRPVHVSPVEGCVEGEIVSQRELITCPGASNAQHYFLGRWVLDDSTFYYGAGAPTQPETFFHAMVTCEYDVVFDLCVSLKTACDWTLVLPYSFLTAQYGPNFRLEYKIDVDDNGRLYIELRGRAVESTPGATYPWRIELDIHGNVNKDPRFPPYLYPPGVTPLPAAFNFAPGIGDTGFQTLTDGWGLAGVSGHTISGLGWRIKNGRVSYLLSMKVGTAITVPTNGDLPNPVFGSVPFWLRPIVPAPFSTLSTGPLVGGYISQTDGSIILSAVAPGTSLAVNTVLQIGGSYDL